MAKGIVTSDPLIDHVAAISCGIYAGQPVLDLDYLEDSAAGTDGNFVITGRGKLVEVQASAEGAAYSVEDLTTLLNLGLQGTKALVEAQKEAIAA